jgi:hypothetical protein
MSTLDARMLQRRDTAANWTSSNPTLASGEIGFETDTGRGKLGNNSTTWANLPYSIGPIRRSVAVFVAGKPSASEIVWRDVITNATSFTVAANSTDCAANATTAATANTTVLIGKNGVTVGSYNWAANATTATVNLPASVSFVAGDIRQLTANSTVDATLANISITLSGGL